MSETTQDSASPDTEQSLLPSSNGQNDTNSSSEPTAALAQAAEHTDDASAPSLAIPIAGLANLDSESTTSSINTATNGEGTGSQIVGAFQVSSVTTGTISAGGDVAVGSNITQTKIVYEGDTEYQVDLSLPDPYPGLRSYRSDEANKYTGRDDDIDNAVAQLTDSADPKTILFITGVAGSGKSSFAQAGLLPALVEHYKQFGTSVRTEVFQPLNQPFAQMAAALGRMFTVSPPDAESISNPTGLFNFIAAQSKGAATVNVLLVDQFEELSTQTPSDLRHNFLTLLTSLPPFKQCNTHIIITLRDDYLPILADNQQLLSDAQQGIKLGVMNADSLQQAIARPLQQLAAPRIPRLNPQFCQRLAQDTAADASYLPFMQATLQQMWQSGSLDPANYNSLTDSIEKQANAEYQHYDQASQQTILDLFLDLVGMVPDQNFPPTRIARARHDLVKDSPGRNQIVDALVAADLLTAQTNAATGDAQIGIIHDSLLKNWATLRDAITDKRPQLINRGRFEGALADWVQNGRKDSYLLSPTQLATARELAAAGDICMASVEASDFLQRSQTAQQVLERSTQRQRFMRIFASAVSVLFIAAVIAGIIAWANAVEVEQKADIIKSLPLAIDARNEMSVSPTLALLLSSESVEREDSELSESALSDAVAQTSGIVTLNGHTDFVNSATFNHKGDRIVTSSYDGTARLWGIDGTKVVTLTVGNEIVGGCQPQATDKARNPTVKPNKAVVRSAKFSPDDKYIVTAAEDGTARVWDNNGTLHATMVHSDVVLSATFNHSSNLVLTASADCTARIWDAQGNLRATLVHSDIVYTAEFSPDDSHIVTASKDKTAKLWDANGKLLHVYNHPDYVNSATFSPDGQLILTACDNGNAYIWNLDGTKVITLAHNGPVSKAIFNSDGSRILTVSADRTARLWDTSGNLITVLGGHTRDARYPFFSPLGNYILVSSYDGTARLWDKDGTPLAVVVGYGLGFSPDESHMILGPSQGVAVDTAHNQVELRPVRTSDLLSIAACQVSRGLTADEIRQFNVGTPRFDFSKRTCPPQ